jgi:uncharacterized protein YfiM (DUF2279 family)
MRALVLVLALQLPRDGWFGADKLKHAILSAFVESVSYAALRSVRVERGPALGVAAGVTLSVGVGKEWHDHRRGERFSVRDLSWDVAGAAGAAILLDRTR